MINIVWGSTDKPIASRQLAETISLNDSLDGTLYIGYPIIGTPEGSFPIDAILVTKQKGLIIFTVIEGRELPDYGKIQDEAATKMMAKLFQHPSLVKKRDLKFETNTLTFAPAIQESDLPDDKDYPVCGASNLCTHIDSLDEFDETLYTALVSVLQAISTLRRGRKKRSLGNPDSRASKLKSIENSIANLDVHQSAAVIETFDGVQRIRGLAGCGKTIVLALKAAYLHTKHPDWKIAVTFNTRSLKKQFENLITTFVLEQANEEPDWDNVCILNAWGASGGKERSGIYYEFCKDHGVEYFDFGKAKVFGAGQEFEGACGFAINSTKQYIPKYDAILVDEAQDFAPNFLLLCYHYLKKPNRLVYAYDELQNLGGKSLPPVEEIFGSDENGAPRVTLQPDTPGKPKQDIILDTCYRNPRPILVTAHALGFGIYRNQKGLVQIFESNNLWLDIGYELAKGKLEEGEDVSLIRSERASPAFLESHSSEDDLLQFKTFASAEEQTNWLVEEIRKNIQEDDLIPDDIVVINPDPISTRNAVKSARAKLVQMKIPSQLAGVTTDPDVFTDPGTVTFTGVFRAKGNEAAMVYVINAQDCFDSSSPRVCARLRNRLFTAITRSKAWVRVLGVGSWMEALEAEFESVKKANFSLNFQYPTKEEKKLMTIVNRDMSKVEEDKVEKQQNDLLNIIASLESGDTYVEDYSADLINKLKSLISKD